MLQYNINNKKHIFRSRKMCFYVYHILQLNR